MKRKLWDMLNRFGMPVTMMVLGGVLVISPDTASAMISKLIGWVLTAVGVCFGIGALISANRRVSKVFWALLCLAVGGVLVAQPLLLVKNLGRFLGVLLAIEGGDTLRKGSKVLGVVTLAAALVMVFAPMSASRLVLSLCGVVVLVIGIAMLADRMRSTRRLNGPKDDIIDAL